MKMNPRPNTARAMQTTRPKLTDEQKMQLKTCFELMDADGSGAIDADELQDAFQLLGLDFTRSEIKVSHSSALTVCGGAW
jgi:Ca2+-binding EF-hand superfamily protein